MFLDFTAPSGGGTSSAARPSDPWAKDPFIKMFTMFKSCITSHKWHNFYLDVFPTAAMTSMFILRCFIHHCSKTIRRRDWIWSTSDSVKPASDWASDPLCSQENLKRTACVQGVWHSNHWSFVQSIYNILQHLKLWYLILCLLCQWLLRQVILHISLAAARASAVAATWCNLHVIQSMVLSIFERLPNAGLRKSCQLIAGGMLFLCSSIFFFTIYSLCWRFWHWQSSDNCFDCWFSGDLLMSCSCTVYDLLFARPTTLATGIFDHCFSQSLQQLFKTAFRQNRLGTMEMMEVK